MYDNNNIFAKILRGEISCEKIYEDDSTLSTKLQQYPLVGKIFSSVGYRLAPTTVHKKETLYRHYTVNRTRYEPPYGELTSLPVQEAERVTAQALKEPNR